LIDVPHGLPLGFSSGGDYQCSRHPFPIGSVLVLYTDGLIERRGESIDVGLQRLCAAAAHAIQGQDANFADRVYRQLVEESVLDDDVALLAIESQPLGDKMQLTLEAQPGVLAGMRRVVARWLATQGLDDEDRFNVTLATSEAAGNAIEHAYGAHEATFTVSGERTAAGLRILVRDNGRWRDSSPYGRGRGLAIMRALVDSVEIERGAAGTTVVLTTLLPGAGK
jgi:anti-sigma regulatory factor (Ser/Thr protein kinase)